MRPGCCPRSAGPVRSGPELPLAVRSGRVPSGAVALFGVLLWLLSAACGGGDAGSGAGQLVTGFDRPVAALHDDRADVYLVACASEPACVVRVLPNGTLAGRLVVDKVAGATLDAPMAMALHGDGLWIADGGVVREFDRASGAPRGLIEPGAGEIQGLAIAPDGALWFTALGSAGVPGGVHRWRDNHLDLHADVSMPQVPPRLGPVVALDTGAYTIERASGRFLQVDRDGRVTELVRFQETDLRGLVRPGPGQWWATSGDGRCLLVADLQGGVRRYPGLELDDPGDFDVDRGRRRLLVPLGRSGALLLHNL